MADASPAEQLPLAAINGASTLSGKQSNKDGTPHVTAVHVNGDGVELSPSATGNGHSAA